MTYLQYLGLDGGRRRIDISKWNKTPYQGHVLVFVRDTTYPLQIHNISLACTVGDREIWVFVEFTKNFLNTMKENGYAISVHWDDPNQVLTPRGTFRWQSPSFLQHPPQISKVGYIIDRHRKKVTVGKVIITNVRGHDLKIRVG